MLRRLIVMGVVLATAALLLFLQNKVLVGEQDLAAELRPMPSADSEGRKAWELVLKDAGGTPRQIERENEWEALRSQLDRRLAGDAARGRAAIVHDEPRRSADGRIVLAVPADADETELRSRIQGKPFRRPNEGRDLFHLTKGIDLRGGVEFICRLHDDNGDFVPANPDVVGILRARLDERGLTEPSVTTMSNGSIQVVIPGGTAADAARTRKVLESSGRLEFREVLADYPSADYPSTIPGDPRCAVLRKGAGWTFAPGVPRNRGDIVVPKEREIGQDPTGWLRLAPVSLVGADVKDANQTLHEGQLAVAIEFTAIGAGKNEEFTRMVKQHGADAVATGRLAITFDGVLKSDPRVIEPSSAHCVISGRFSQDEVDTLKTALKGGALSVTPEVVSERVVGATLGEQTVTKAFVAMGAAALAIILFMFWYYRWLGLVANLCLLVCGVLILATLSVFSATITLPGIAGLVLTIGMAVDTNILIFERIREELRENKGMKAAISAGYDRAFLTIFDSNLTTLITAFILYWIGSGPVKGFGLSLMIGLVISMFTGVYLGRLLTDWIFRKRQHATMASWIPELKLPYVEWRWFGYAFSILTAVIGLGWFCFGHKVVGGGFQRNFDIDFTGGTMAQAIFTEPKSFDQVEQAVKDAYAKLSPEDRAKCLLQPAELRIQPYYASLGGNAKESRQWAFRCRDDEGSRIEAERAKVELTKAAVQKRITEALEQTPPDRAAVARIEREEMEPIVARLRDLSAQIAGRTAEFKRQIVAAFPGAIADEGAEVVSAAWKDRTLTLGIATLETPTATQISEIGARLGHGASIAVAPLEGRAGLLVAATYAEKPKPLAGVEFDDHITARIADLLKAAGTAPDDLRAEATVALDLYNSLTVTAAGLKLTVAKPFPASEHFSGQVADRMKIIALVSILLSLVAMLAYVAVRFEFRFGVGAVVALFHDTLLTIGVISMLGIKIDLTVVAAILTIIGYSINDTIVTFDRIRENLPRLNKPLPEVIDISIAQTMPRTVLTVSTVLITVILLLLYGGESLYAFNMTLLVGLISGTYSSIFVASPLIISFKGKVYTHDDEAGKPAAGPEGVPAA